MDLAQTRVEQASQTTVHTLDSLAAMTSDALERVYGRGTLPLSLAALDGHPRGRMLATRGLDAGFPARALRGLAAAPAFPWGGKSFHAASAEAGTGINRVHLLGRHQLFPFQTRFAPSVIDGRRAILLDYDLPDNPLLIRRIHDEVREVSPGVFLGPAMWKSGSERTLVLWFALDTRDQARPIGEC